jgi:ubiquinone/menaquinone biosynthesis C-methylase UbiE
MTVKRTHDFLYLKEERKQNTKESFKFIEFFNRDFIKSRNCCLNILDIGCATGDFLYFIRNLYPKAGLYGCDIIDELLEKAKKEVDGVSFFNANIFSGEMLPDKKFDLIFCTGVISIFDDIQVVLKNILGLAKKGGRVNIFALFNPEDLDVLIKTRRSSEKGAWEVGWNVWSKQTIVNYLNIIKKQLNIDFDFEFKDFEIQIDLAKNRDDALRSWTEKYENGRRFIINGLQLIHTFSLLIIDLKE